MTMVDAERDNQWAELRQLRQHEDWQGALAACSRRHDPLLLWLQPTRAVLAFIGAAAARHRVRRLLSVGCGSGLFEWLLAGATGLEVTGVEVNRGWWESRYSPPTFLPLTFPDEECGQADVEEALRDSTDSAIMFCYFNDTAAFLGYLRAFRGRLLLVAGPGPGADAHCHPHPFSADIPAPWRLEGSAAVAGTADHVAVYVRPEAED